jgi:hypothetical protein
VNLSGLASFNTTDYHDQVRREIRASSRNAILLVTLFGLPILLLQFLTTISKVGTVITCTASGITLGWGLFSILLRRSHLLELERVMVLNSPPTISLNLRALMAMEDQFKARMADTGSLDIKLGLQQEHLRQSGVIEESDESPPQVQRRFARFLKGR